MTMPRIYTIEDFTEAGRPPEDHTVCNPYGCPQGFLAASWTAGRGTYIKTYGPFDSRETAELWVAWARLQ